MLQAGGGGGTAAQITLFFAKETELIYKTFIHFYKIFIDCLKPV